MKRLIALSTLGLVLSFSSLSFASDYMTLYTKPISKSEVRNEITGGTVDRDSMSFYTSPKPTSTEHQLISDPTTDEDYVTAFGVRIVL
ncbi:MAG TPA: hypothetical protein VHT73_15215 [Thermodesulfobacteriota bacterium]|nr:hypothetical protein [Thermodesulfobacteriota bacterium]